MWFLIFYVIWKPAHIILTKLVIVIMQILTVYVYIWWLEIVQYATYMHWWCITCVVCVVWVYNFILGNCSIMLQVSYCHCRPFSVQCASRTKLFIFFVQSILFPIESSDLMNFLRAFYSISSEKHSCRKAAEIAPATDVITPSARWSCNIFHSSPLTSSASLVCCP